MTSSMTILALGYHDPNGSRHVVMREALEQCGYNVIDCSVRTGGLLTKYIQITKLFWKHRRQAPFVLIPFQGHHLVPLIWFYCKFTKQKIIFDAFISLYDSLVLDRGLVRPRSLRAHWLWWIDYISCHLSDVVILDTPEHKQYFCTEFRLSAKNIVVVPIGCNTSTFYPNDAPAPAEFTVLFHGTFIPLQGIETIVHAAKILQEKALPIHFSFIGKGQTYSNIKQLADDLHLNNCTWHGMQPIETVSKAITSAQCCLGIFGTTPKADRVIPHKAYEILACRKPLITGSTTASRNYFTNTENVLLTNPGDPVALADAIETLYSNADLRQKIAEKGYALFLKTCDPKVMITELITSLHTWQ